MKLTPEWEKLSIAGHSLLVPAEVTNEAGQVITRRTLPVHVDMGFLVTVFHETNFPVIAGTVEINRLPKPAKATFNQWLSTRDERLRFKFYNVIVFVARHLNVFRFTPDEAKLYWHMAYLFADAVVESQGDNPIHWVLHLKSPFEDKWVEARGILDPMDDNLREEINFREPYLTSSDGETFGFRANIFIGSREVDEFFDTDGLRFAFVSI